MEDDSIRGEITPQVTKEDINQTKKVRKRKNKGKTDTSIEHPNIDHPNVLDTSQLEGETHERVEQLQPVQPVQPVQQVPVTPAASLTDLIQVPDGQGGYRTVRLIKRPVVQPTVWFPISSAPPWWSVQANINVLYWLMIVAAFVLRFWRIDLPKYVVFDEVHFGKFASYYLSNSFFFDVHPPLGKLVFAFIGYCNNFNGSFLFTTIGEEFPSEVPYVLMRGASALCGSLLIPSIYEIMIQLGFTHRGALLACFFTLFDNSLQTQSRVIMLDSFVVLFTYMSIMGYLKVYHYRSQ
jgi:dolichyl-phosphate-mannose-protein mannosyltransferase